MHENFLPAEPHAVCVGSLVGPVGMWPQPSPGSRGQPGQPGWSGLGAEQKCPVTQQILIRYPLGARSPADAEGVDQSLPQGDQSLGQREGTVPQMRP